METRKDSFFGRLMIEQLQWGHGFPAVETTRLSATRPWASLLQWGHGFPAVGTWDATNELPMLLLLQWGHGFPAVETGLVVCC